MDTCGSDFDTELVIWDAFGNVVAQNDDACGPAPARQSVIEITLPAGDYFVAFTGYNAFFGSDFALIYAECSDSGNYQFNVDINGGFLFDEFGTLGSSRVKLIHFAIVDEDDCDGIPDIAELDCDNDGIPDDCQIPTFVEAFDVGVVGNSDESFVLTSCFSDFDTEIAIWNENGVLLAQNDDDNEFFCAESFQSSIEMDLAPGIYYTAIAGYNTAFDDLSGIFIEVNALGSCSEGGIYELDFGPKQSTSGVLEAGQVILIQFEIEAPLLGAHQQTSMKTATSTSSMSRHS